MKFLKKLLEGLKKSFVVRISLIFLIEFVSAVISVFSIIQGHYYIFFISFSFYLIFGYFIYEEIKRFSLFLNWILKCDYEEKISDVILKKNDDLKEFILKFKERLSGESRLLREKEILEEYRASFLSRISHELLSPLSVIKGYINLLSKKEDDLKKLDYIEKIIRSVSRLEIMINNFVVSTREGLYPAVYEFKIFDLTELLFEIYEENLPLAQERNINFVLKMPPFPNIVIGDPGALKSGITNILNNALKFTTPGGEVIIEAERENNKMKVSIIDTGPGISKEELPYIFKPYFQGKEARTKKLGMGLGLSIAKEIIEAHGSEIYVESEPGKGSKFYFYLQIKL